MISKSGSVFVQVLMITSMYILAIDFRFSGTTWPSKDVLGWVS